MRSVRWILIAVFACNALLFCCGMAAILFLPSPEQRASDANVLRVGYSPEKETLFRQLADGFNRSGTPYRIEPVKFDPDDLIELATSGRFAAVSPDSAVWLDQIDRAWQTKNPDAPGLASSLTRYAVSPIVIAMWERVAREFNYPARPVGWATILDRALRDPNFRWSHPSTATASGLLAVTAEFYAGAGNPPRLSLRDIERPETVEFVRRIQRTVQQYGAETEDQLIARLLAGERRNLDAFVVQEQFVILFNTRTSGEKLVAVYPAEGSLWLDHPLALLEGPWLTAEQRRAYRAFTDYLSRPETGQLILAAGYRPADLRVALDERTSPIQRENGVDPAQPFTSLVLPATPVLERIRDSWALLKRPANIYLIADVSGSMQGDRITRARDALLSFVDQIKDGRDRVGFATFSTATREQVPLDTLEKNRGDLERAIRAMTPGGNTALYDAIDFGVQRVSELREPDRINVVLVMTDGEENASRRELVAGRGDPSRLIAAIQERMRRTGTPVIVVTIAYGGEAEFDVLRRIAESTNGQAYRSDPETIRKLYRTLSQAF
ncbi:MAG: VWA domain-containing protein [Chloroflexota bacterium]|nr:VWA domain-containing protein [Dehalococcoidia bacterium]MDW8252684.1 VWA domain-containing protein [Chloroflexota bacterium]